jgi:hypothetical protein
MAVDDEGIAVDGDGAAESTGGRVELTKSVGSRSTGVC